VLTRGEGNGNITRHSAQGAKKRAEEVQKWAKNALDKGSIKVLL
jgi:hypothetical protein